MHALNQCHRHINVKSDLGNDSITNDASISNETANMIHENHNIINTRSSAFREPTQSDQTHTGAIIIIHYNYSRSDFSS